MKNFQSRQELPLAWKVFFIVILLAAASEMFFDVYRIAYFRAVSFDDYAPYLLYVLGSDAGAVPSSPFSYRVGSVILATPFYLVPFIQLSNGAGIDPMPTGLEMGKAVQAMSAANVFYLVLTVILVFVYLHRRLRAGPEIAFIGAAATFLLGNHVALDGNDGISIFPLLVTLLLGVERRWAFFLVALLIGTVVNEKIPLIAMLIFGFRAALPGPDRRFDLFAAGASALALCAYIAMITAFPVPGINDNQRIPATYLPAAWAALGRLVEAKGAYRNLWPLLILVALWFYGMRVPAALRFLRISDLGAILALLTVTFMLNVGYNVGRIMMYMMPFLMIGAIQGLAAQGHFSWRWINAPPAETEIRSRKAD